MARNHDITKCNKLLCCVEQIDAPRGADEVTPPVVESFYKPSEEKERFLNLVATGGLDYIVDAGEDEQFDNSESDDESELFNRAMENSPYAVGSDGLANFERQLAKNDEEVRALRMFMNVKDNPDFQNFMEQFSGLGPDEIASKLVGIRSLSEQSSDEKRDDKKVSESAGSDEDTKEG